MNLVTIDFETYYDKDYSLSKLTTEEYVRDPRFEIIGVGVKYNNADTEWASGTHAQIQEYLTDSFDWQDSMLLCHNTMFDGAILNWKLGITPRVYADTMCMARALHGVETSASLRAVAERYGVGQKGIEVLNAKGKKRSDFSDSELDKYGDYCVNDVNLTYELFKKMGKYIPRKEFKLIDLTLRMFVCPSLHLDVELLNQHLAETKARKEKL
jgi:DNA polymerase I - 3''-5'' exonuclease and polymerase domains